MTDLIIIGAGGFGREVAWLASEARDDFNTIGFLDDRLDIPASELDGYSLLGKIDEWNRFSQAALIIAVGNPRTRLAVARRVHENGTPRFATLIHKSCNIGPVCRIAPGAIICAGCTLTTNIEIQAHVIVNINSTIGHDSIISAYATIAPQVAISGCVTIGAGSEIGTAAAIKQGIQIGSGSMLGMGSCLTKNLSENMLAFGLPAKPLKALLPFNSTMMPNI